MERETELDDGTTATREVVRHQGTVAIVPVLDSAVILVRQFRITVGKEVLEIPAGRIEEGEAPADAARRELEEETGYRAARLIAGPSYYSSVGFVDERVHLFLALNLALVKAEREPAQDERVRSVLMPFAEVEERLASNGFEDSKTLIGLRGVLLYFKGTDASMDTKALYAWYADENHKYNTLIWQFPAAIIALNILAVEKLGSSSPLLLTMWMINNVLLLCVAKHVYHQRCFTEALYKLNEQFRARNPELPIVKFPRDGWYRIFRLKATWFLVGALVLFNQAYLVAVLWRTLWKLLSGSAG